jgi:hypothetical protein
VGPVRVIGTSGWLIAALVVIAAQAQNNTYDNFRLGAISWGGGDEQSNLALVCVGGGTDHHGHLAPTGKYLLLGNPNCPDGLHLARVDQLAALAELAADQARAGPVAA